MGWLRSSVIPSLRYGRMQIRQGQIYDFNFGPRLNSLQEGKRPVVVVQADTLNAVSGYKNVIVVPLTTKHKPAATFVQVAPSDENGLTQLSWAITNQIFTVAQSDLLSAMGQVTSSELYAIKGGMKIALGIG